ELLIGESLEDRLARRGRLPFAEVRDLAKPLLRALHAAHRAQVVHRDLKPGNVMLIPREDGEQVLVTDFGVAVATSGPSASSGWLGSPGYMAPEQLRGETVGPAADIYALGTLLFEALSGRLPYEVDPREILPDLLRRRLRHEPPALRTYLPEIDARWEAAIHRCLSRDPRDRFPSCEDLLRALGLEGERRVESIVFLTPSLVTEVVEGADSADVGWPSLVHDLVSGLVARGDEIRVPRSQDVARVERDLGIDVSEPTEADIVRIVQAFGVQRAALLRMVRSEGGRLECRFHDRNGTTTDVIACERGERTWIEAAERIAELVRLELGLEPLSAGSQERVLALLPRGDAARAAYAEGLDALRAREVGRAVDRLREAAALDPECAAVQAALADSFEVSGEQAAAAAAAKRAVLCSAGLDRREQIELEARERGFALDRVRCEELYRALMIFYPDVTEYPLRLIALLGQAGRAPEAFGLLESLRAQELPPEADLRANALECDLKHYVGDIRGMAAAADALTEKARSLGATRLLARGCQSAGTARVELGELDEGVALLEEALGLYRKIRDLGGEVHVTNTLGSAALTGGRLQEAGERYRNCVRACRELGLQQSIGTPIHNLASVEEQRGYPDEALRLYDEALQYHTQEANRRSHVWSMHGRAGVLHLLDRLDEAEDCWRQALQACSATGDAHGESNLRAGLGLLLLDRGQIAEGTALLEESLTLARQTDVGYWITYVLGALGRAAQLSGDLAAALAWVDQIAESEAGEQSSGARSREELRGMLSRAEILHSARRTPEAQELVDLVARRAALTESFELEQRCEILRAHMLESSGDVENAAARLETVKKRLGKRGYRLLVRQMDERVIDAPPPGSAEGSPSTRGRSSR
ncbi:MAG: tetratricopeptide repeat protein, partial [Candidatus Eisenbacteria bacterium]|nr:tetratricopeptide repeat protein [Candidatus Eisenbacteria bacterium]